MKKTLFTLGLALITYVSFAQNTAYMQRAQSYVLQYKDWAIEEQQRTGIPAAITLAQGIYETNAGESELATQANNHFGIKCKKEWTGATFAHTDDAPNECFRKYNSAKESYTDHSDYLKKSPRYAMLFDLDQTNYEAWAKGLKHCGYATNPQYAQKLIKVIEDFNLQEYTLEGQQKGTNAIVAIEAKNVQKLGSIGEQPKSISEIAQQAEQKVMGDQPDGIQKVNGLKAIYCRKGEMLLDKAVKYDIRYARLLEINELADEPLKRTMVIYLEKKNPRGAKYTHVVSEGETIEQIAQDEGMHARQLRAFNMLAQNEQPAIGSVLHLQDQASEKPAIQNAITQTNTRQASERNIKTTSVPAAKEDFIATQKVAKEEEVVIGYGAEAPVFDSLKKETAQQSLVSAIEEQKAVAPVKEVVKEAEPQDELAKLKAKLDKAVYANSAPKSSVKVTSDGVPVITAKEPQQETIPETSNPQYHTVEKGDTAYSIAQKYNIKVSQLRAWNNLNFEGIKTGQKLRVK